MLYGQIKYSEDFYHDHEGAIEGSLRGLVTGGVVGGFRQPKDRELTPGQKTRNILTGSLIGGVTGGGMGTLLDHNRENIAAHINALYDKLHPKG